MTVLKRLLGYLTPYWKQLIFTATLLILLTVFGLLPPLFQKQIIDEVIGTRDLSRLGVLIAGLVGVHALIQAANSGDLLKLARLVAGSSLNHRWMVIR